MCSIDDVDGVYDVWDIHEVKSSRKAHRCSECCREIEPGEPYTRFSGLSDGEWDHTKMCQHCLKISEWLERNCEGWVPQEVRADYQDHINLFNRFDQLRAFIGLEKGWRRYCGGLMAVPEPSDLWPES